MDVAPHTSSAVRAALSADVRRGLLARPRSIPPKWFYDDVGSRLFDEICELPEYYLTRAERSILVEQAANIAARSAAVELFELGSGSAKKTGLLLQAMAARTPHPRYVPFDISRAALEGSARALRTLVPSLQVDPVEGDMEHDLGRVPLSPSSPRLFAFLGSTIGNFDERAAPELLGTIARRMRRGDTFLVGFDLVKDVPTLERAYDDAAGVTARFNKNVLTVIDRLLDADFDLDAFAHRARYDVERARIEMHLESLRAQKVHLRALDLVIELDRGERILTEISRKFTRETVESTLREAGLSLLEWYSSPGDLFALALAEAR